MTLMTSVMSTDEGEPPMKAGDLVIVPLGGTRGMRPEGGRLVVLATAILGAGAARP